MIVSTDNIPLGLCKQAGIFFKKRQKRKSMEKNQQEQHQG
jgi:hypothetical protein